ACFHRADVALPLVGCNWNERLVLGTGEPHEISQRHAHRARPPVLTLRERGRERRVVATARREELANPECSLVAPRRLPRGGEIEAFRQPSARTMSTSLRPRRVPNFTTPSAVANSVSSRPRPTL